MSGIQCEICGRWARDENGLFQHWKMKHRHIKQPVAVRVYRQRMREQQVSEADQMLETQEKTNAD